MGKDKGSRPRKASENKQEPASRSPSAATAARVPLPASSPTPESATGDSSDHEEEMQPEPSEEGRKSPQNLEDPQNQYASQVGTDPALTDDGPLASAQIEPSLGEIDEERASSGAGEDFQLESPTSADLSISPASRRSSYNLAAELKGQGWDDSDGDMRTEAGDQGTSSTVAQTAGTPGVEESQKPEAANSAKSESIEEEKSKRLAAEEQVRKLRAEMKDQRQKFEEEAEKAKTRHEKALEKANIAREAEKVKLEEKAELNVNNFRGEIAKYEKSIEDLQALKLGAHAEDPGRPNDSDADGDMSRQEETAAMGVTSTKAINRDLLGIHRGPHTRPVRNLPRANTVNIKPGSARFLLAQCDFLLDKKTPVYAALRTVANYADGGELWPNERTRRMLANFNHQLDGIVQLMECHMYESPNRCLEESRNDWRLALDSWNQGTGGRE
ncbi:hypothetical protein KVR01_001862 [Diaporthe batatas]|uniref:uncharacterized protein n=1 Tax=Diaporthe batatas TaxID=748121 RepID=UPI001D036803|nr:uncharacterized protein KVR01_001862 [Diaporthe batatas]KAG8169113.1 hypothetical protein KVR01_001862 [Diaporthe batatas]